MAYKSGFTFIELLLSVSIIFVLAIVVFVALDPMDRLQTTRDARRWTDVNSLLTGIHEYIVDHDGEIPPQITATEQQIGTCISGGNDPCLGAATGCLDLSATLSAYFFQIPADPSSPDEKTYYAVSRDQNNIVTVRACNAEGPNPIQVSR